MKENVNFKVESFDLETKMVVLRKSSGELTYAEISAFCGNDIDWFLAWKPFGKIFRRIGDFYIPFSIYEIADRSDCGFNSLLEEAYKLDTLYPELGMSRCFVKAVKDYTPGRLF